ncbi:MAG TPA: hypothetical protein VFE33_35025 [Thermoanaerobaculia bacterium]|nr:hypothetical protein [Thermoanaerobaculia bacterium]
MKEIEHGGEVTDRGGGLGILIFVGIYLVYAVTYALLWGIKGSAAAGWLNLAVQTSLHLLVFVMALKLSRVFSGTNRHFLLLLAASGCLGILGDAAYNYFVNVKGVDTNSSSLGSFLYQVPLCLFLVVWIMAFLRLLIGPPDDGVRPPTSRLVIVFYALTIVGFFAAYFTLFVSVLASARLDILALTIRTVLSILEAVAIASGLLFLLIQARGWLVLTVVGILVLLCNESFFQTEEILGLKRPRSMLELSWSAALFLILMGLVRARDEAKRRSRDKINLRGHVSAIVAMPLGLISAAVLGIGRIMFWDYPNLFSGMRYIFFALSVGLVVVVAIITTVEEQIQAALNGLYYFVIGACRRQQSNPVANVHYILENTGVRACVDRIVRELTIWKARSLELGPEAVFEVGAAGRNEQGTPVGFVLMPFETIWSDVYEEIRNAVGCEGLLCLRADELYGRNVMADLWSGIYFADVVVADLTGRNANVLYEVGIAHALAKPVILLAQSDADIPFDLRTRRVVIYKATEVSEGALCKKIRLLIKDILAKYPPATESR